MSDNLIASEMAEMCRVEVETARYWRSAGIGPKWFRLPGSRRVLYAREDVEEWINEARAASAHGGAA